MWDLKLQIHIIEKECASLADVIGHVILLMLDLYNSKITVCLCVHSFVFEMVSRLIAKGIIRSCSMRKRRATVKPLIGIISDCDVCGGFMFNAQRYMCINDVYFAHSTICFPYEVKKLFDRILHELEYLDREHPHHFTLDLDQLDRIFKYRFIQSGSYSVPVTNIELEYMFDTLGFLWLHHDNPQHLLYFLEKLVDHGLADERMKPPRSTATTTTL